MKLTLTIPASVLLLGALAALPAADQPAAPAAPATSAAPARKFTDAELQEFLGWYIGKQTGMGDFAFTDAEFAAIAKGFAAAAAGKDAPFKAEEIGEQFGAYMTARQKVAADKVAAKEAEQGKKNKADGEKFLADKKLQKGVVALPSGLLYEIVQPGTGANPKATDTVRVNYTGTFIDGTVFDATTKHTSAEHPSGEPAEFPLNGVISGWTEGLQKIAKGGKIKLYVPPDLAYGPDGRPGIPPNSTLAFEVELLDINPPNPPKPKQ